jgi:hypothetical protein
VRIHSFIGPLTGLLALSCLCLGQETRSTIYGRVLDPQASAVAGAAVVVTNLDTNVASSLQTNGTGYYEAALLLPGNYRVTVEAAGFKKSLRTGIILPVSTRAQIDVPLELGAVAETVSVTADAPLLETNAVTSGRVMDNRNLMDLPALGNNPALLVALTPGIQAGGINKYNSLHTLGGASDYSTAGKVGGNEFSIDGAPNTRGRGPSYLPSSDSLQEFKVETSRFDASIGHSTGVNIAMMTKAGTNQLHGTATEQHWQQRWNGTPFFTKQKYYRDISAAEAAGNHALAEQLRSEDKQGSGHSNTYTGTVGGPVYIPRVFDGRNRLFFFFSFAGFQDRKRPEGNLNRTLPTLAARDGNLSQLLQVDAVRYQVYDPLSVRADPARPTHFIRDPIPGNIIPRARFANPAYDAYLKLIPKPNNENGNPKLEPSNNYLAVRMPFDWTYSAETNRTDYQLSNAHRFFFSWNHYNFWEDGYDWSYETVRGLHGDGFDWGVLGGTVSWVWTASSRTVFDFMFAGSNYKNAKALVAPFQYKPSDVGLPAYMDAKAGSVHMLPQMNFSGYDTFGRLATPVEHLSVITQKANVSHVRANHTVHAGVDIRQHRRTATAAGNTSGSFTFSNFFTRRYDDTFTPAGDLGLSWAAFILGVPNGASIATNDSFAIQSPYFGWYVQDDWRLTPRLSVNLGLRLEYETGGTERYNRMIGEFDPALGLPISSAAQSAYAASPVAERSAASFQARGGSVYANVNGTPRNIVRSQLMALPRIGVAYQANPKTVLRAGYGVFYDTFNVHNFSISQNGFSRTTSSNITNDFGVNWLVGNPRAGVSPMSDPFPVRSDGTRFDAPVRDALGGMAVVGRSFSYTPYDISRSREQRWRAGVQRQLGGSMVVEAAYAGTWASSVYVSRNMNPLPEQFWANGQTRNDSLASNLNANVTNPFYIGNFADLAKTSPIVYQDMSTNGFFTSRTIRKDLLLRPFPQMSGLTAANTPLGGVKANEIQITFERRFAGGFNLNAGYTRSWIRASDFFENEFDLSPTWRESNNGRPHRFIATGIYQLPFGKGRTFFKSGPLSWIAGGFQLSATYEWQPGPLLRFGNLFYSGSYDQINTGSRTLDRWFNTDGFERSASKGPASFHRRVFPTQIDGLRQDMTNQWNANVMREFKIRERAAFQIRLDAINATNRSQFDAPDLSPYSTNFGRITAQTTATNRIVQLVGRLRF